MHWHTRMTVCCRYIQIFAPDRSRLEIISIYWSFIWLKIRLRCREFFLFWQFWCSIKLKNERILKIYQPTDSVFFSKFVYEKLGHSLNVTLDVIRKSTWSREWNIYKEKWFNLPFSSFSIFGVNTKEFIYLSFYNFSA